MLKIKELYSGYNGVDIIKNVNLQVDKGEILFIIGPNGCGKSTLLKSIANLIEYRGTIKFDGVDSNKYERKSFAQKVGLMSQLSEIHFPYTVYETVSLGRYPYLKGAFSSLSKEDVKIILDSIEKVGLTEYRDKMITELSGGQIQRVFLAKLFAQNPDIILLDEPTNHLDFKYQVELLEHVKTWAKTNKKIVIGVLHDLNLVHYFADKVIMLDNGNIVSEGTSMEVLNDDKLKNVYDIDIKSTRRIRGAILCTTNQGLFVLRELMISEKRIPMLHKLYAHMMENGCDRVDEVIENKEHELFSTSEDGIKYVVKRWYDGKECDIRKEQEIVGATKNLAKLHKVLRGPIDFGEESETFVMEGEDLRKEYCRHNREMKKVRAFIRGKVGKGEFELAFLKHFDAMYDWAQSASVRLENSEYELLVQQSKEKTTITHGEYNYHNVLMVQDGIATTNFEHFHQDVQLADLYYFIRKTMEKNRWNILLGDKIIDAYSQIMSLGKHELEYLAISLSYPEKFWKAANSYYRSSKAWIPTKSVEKLEMAIRQMDEKKHFLETIFSFHL